MLDGLQNGAGKKLGAGTREAHQACDRLDVWVRWSDDEAALSRFAKPRGAVEQFTLLDIERDAEDPTVWRCAFSHVGRRINIEHQILSLLRRLSPVAAWIKAERRDAAAAAAARSQDDPRELDWDDFARRALP